MSDLRQWLQGLGLERFAEAFEREELTFDNLPELTDEELKELGLPLGPRKTVLKAIEAMSGTTAIRSLGAPDSYTPKHLAEKILTSRSALEGERKLVTVLFADLKGSMELLADRDPEEARKILDPVLERMMEAVHHYEGTVNQVMGDGVMALFGAPLAHEDHAVRACYAALRMQEAVKRYAGETRRTQGVEVDIRVGLNSGEVVVRSIGSDLRMDYTAVGQTTHLAARMEQLASPGTIRLTADTLRLAEGYVEVKSLGPIPVKGLPEPVEVYELTGAGMARTRLQAAALRGLTRFVGRDAEVEHLRRVLGKAGAGRGQVIAIVGEAGVGKSRLVYEFTHSHRVQEWLILEASSVSYGKATSYLPVIDLLKGYFKIGDRDDHRDIREKVTGRLLALDRALEPTLSAFLALLDVPVEEPGWQVLDPLQRRQRTLDAVKRLLLRESQVHPVLLIVEDLHWIDTETQAVLDSLVESLPTARLLLLVDYRPEYQHGWSGKTYYTQLRIDPLPPENAEALLDALLGDDPALQALKRMLIAQTEGNPFFLEECVRALVESRALTGERRAYRLVRDVTTIQVPSTTQAVLAARIDRLPPEDKRLLQTAAVIGKDVPFELLQAIADPSEPDLYWSLGRLQAAEFLYETAHFPEPEYTFKHALTHEVAYASLLQERRRALHARIVEVIEMLYARRLAEHVDRLAYHSLGGERWDKAVTYYRQAGGRAFERSANHEAVNHYSQALVAVSHLPETRTRTELAIDLRFELRNALLPLGENRRILPYVLETAALAEDLGDRRRGGWASAYLTSAYMLSGDQERALAAAERALTDATEYNDADLKVATNFFAAHAYEMLGDYRRAVELMRRNLIICEGALEGRRFGLAGPASVLCRADLTRRLAFLGEFTEGVCVGQEAARLADALATPFSLVYSYWSLGVLYEVKGDSEKAIEALERARRLGETYGIDHMLRLILRHQGRAFMHLRRIDEALSGLERAARMIGSKGDPIMLGGVLAELGEAYLLMDRATEAASLAWRGLELARQQKERGEEARILSVLGEIESRRQPPDREGAQRYYLEAMSNAAELGMRPLVAHCHLGLGRLYRRTGQRGQAQEHLTTATTMYREMEMRYWLEQAEREGSATGR